jgi:ankyrin repeat protein
VVVFLLENGASVNLRTNDGRTALHAAVGSTPSLPEKQQECVRLLLQHSALVNAQDKLGITPLMNAAWFGCPLCVPELLKGGAAIGLKDAQGRTAKEMAVSKGRHKIVEILTEAGKVKGQSGRTGK